MTDIEKKIQKLLALSNSDNIHEATAAMLKAQEMMLKYHLQGSDETNAGEVVLRGCGFIARGLEQLLVTIVSRNFRTKGYRTRGDIIFVGYEVDVTASISCFDFLINQMRKEKKRLTSTKWYKEKQEGKINRISTVAKTWEKGFVDGVKDAFDRQTRDSAYELMLITPIEVQNVYDSLNLNPGVWYGRVQEFLGGDYYESGKAFGRTVMDKRSLDVRRPMLEKHE